MIIHKMMLIYEARAEANSVLFGESNVINIGFDTERKMWTVSPADGAREMMRGDELHELFARLGAVLHADLKVR
jgi:hypothetical protein